MILVIAISAPDYGADMTVINVTDDIVKQFKKHGEKEYPHECCGFILGSFKDKESMGVEYIPASNIKEENRERRFLIDPRVYQKAEDEADERALEQCKEKNNSCVLYFSGKKYVYWKRLNVKQICSEWRISMDFTSRDREEHRLTLSKLLEGKGYAYNYCSNPNFDTQHTIKKLKRQKLQPIQICPELFSLEFVKSNGFFNFLISQVIPS